VNSHETDNKFPPRSSRSDPIEEFIRGIFSFLAFLTDTAFPHFHKRTSGPSHARKHTHAYRVREREREDFKCAVGRFENANAHDACRVYPEMRRLFGKLCGKVKASVAAPSAHDFVIASRSIALAVVRSTILVSTLAAIQRRSGPYLSAD